MEGTKVAELVHEAERARHQMHQLDAGSQRRELLFVLRICDFFVGLPAPLVQSVIAADTPCPLPMAPPYVHGLVPYSEGALAVVDIARFLDLGAASVEPGVGRVVVVRSGELEAGLLCDQALGVHSPSEDSLDQAGVVRGGQLANYTVFECQLRFGRVAFLDLVRLLEAMQLRA